MPVKDPKVISEATTKYGKNGKPHNSERLANSVSDELWFLN